MHKIARAPRLRLGPMGLAVCLWAVPVSASNAASPSQPLWVRLTSPLSTYNAHAGDPVHAILTEGVKQDGDVVLPVGTEIDGVVRSVRKVG